MDRDKEVKSARRVMASAHNLAPYQLSYWEKMDWIAQYFMANYTKPKEEIPIDLANIRVVIEGNRIMSVDVVQRNKFANND